MSDLRRWPLSPASLILAVVGYILSPLSWWNDAFVNFPIAYGTARLLHRVVPLPLEVLSVAAYWATNALGMLMLYAGLRKLFHFREVGWGAILWGVLVYSVVIYGVVAWVAGN